MAHGESQEAALDNANQAMALWIDTAREFGDPVAEPRGERLMLAQGQTVGAGQLEKNDLS
jgi:predicted RNase H-like HicB family nuclease